VTDAPDPGLLTELLREHVDRHAICTGLRRTTVGNSQETWIVDISGVEQPSQLVLRRSAAGGTIEWTDRASEVAALDAARRAGLPVPRVWWWEPDGGTLGRAYLVMDLATGAPPELSDARVRAGLADDLGRWLARLHRDAEPPAGLADES
jgi:aminoglycoside phosphotransferase (APT) family kinase protein